MTKLELKNTTLLNMQWDSLHRACRVIVTSLRRPERLRDRRLAAAVKFGEKCTMNPKHSDMFPRNQPGRDLRTERVPYKEYFCRTDRFYNSSIPAIKRLLNTKYKEKY